MKASSKKLTLALTIALLLSNAPAKATWTSWTSNKMVKAITAAAVCASAYVYYTQEKVSDNEAKMRRSVVEEESPVTMMERMYREVVLGQPERDKKLVGIDPQTGKAIYEKYSATGIVGNAHTLARKYGMPACCVMLSLNETRTKLRTGLGSLGLSKELFESWVPEVPANGPLSDK